MNFEIIKIKFIAFLDLFIPNEIIVTQDNILRKARSITGATFITGLLCFPFVFIYYQLECMLSSMVVLCGLLMIPLILFLMKKTGPSFITATIAGLTLFLPTTLMAFELGGLVSPSILWYIALPVMIIGGVKGRSALIFSCLCCAVLLGFLITDYMFFDIPQKLNKTQYNFLYFFSLSSELLLLTGFFYVYEGLIDNTFKRLKHSEEVHKNLYENSLVGLWRARISDGNMFKVNTMASEIFGHSPENVKQINLYQDDIIPNEDINKIIAALRANGEVSDFETTIKNNNMPDKEISISAVSYPDKGYIEGSVLDITDKKKAERKIQIVQDQMREQAHKAGMADVATDTIHNVGNILNSVKTSSQVIKNTLKEPALENLKKANDLLKENINNIEEFICNDPKGKKLMEYYLKIEDLLENEHNQIHHHSSRLSEKIEMITNVIDIQQNYAKPTTQNELLEIKEVIETALNIEKSALKDYGIVLTKEYQENIPAIYANRTKLVHILINLIKNSRQALTKREDKEKKITLLLGRTNNRGNFHHRIAMFSFCFYILSA